MATTTATRTAPEPTCLFPPYAGVLLATAVGAVALAAHAATLYHGGQQAGSFPREVTRPIAFAMVFNAVVAPAVLVAWLAELVASGVRLARRQAPFRVLVRLLLTLLPAVVLLAGHLRFNPWLPDFVQQVRQLVGGGGA